MALADKRVKVTGGPAWSARAREPVDASSLAVVRVALGAVGVFSAVRIFAYGWVDSLYARPTHRFTYLGFGWVPQPGRATTIALVATMALAGAALALGWRARVAAAVFLASFGWIELIDATTYLNHYWFVTLLAALYTVVPTGSTVARGWVWLLRFQVGVVYAFAGLAKLQGDWLLRGLPLRLWLPARADLPLVGPLLDQPGTARLLALAGAVFDCSIVPLLLWRRTRLVAWLVLVAFHVCTWLLFPIGVFPWLMMGASTVFFEPDWPRRALALARGHLARAQEPPSQRSPPTRPAAARSPRRRRLLAGAAAVWVAVQLALPLRHLAYPGDHRWTAEGYRFAWNVLLVERSGSVTFLVTDPDTDRTWVADAGRLYTPTQLRVMSAEPDLIHQAARAIAAEERAAGREVEVRVDAWASLNGRPAARLIDPDVDLAAQPRDPWPDDWIVPRA
jgi:vitamin K-dependent gamma-carboxylase